MCPLAPGRIGRLPAGDNVLNRSSDPNGSHRFVGRIVYNYDENVSYCSTCDIGISRLIEAVQGGHCAAADRQRMVPGDEQIDFSGGGEDVNHGRCFLACEFWELTVPMSAIVVRITFGIHRKLGIKNSKRATVSKP